MVRWLRNNLVCCLGIASLLALLQIESATPIVRMQRAAADQAPAALPTTSASTLESNGISVLPHGWRRTANGWEHVSSWQRATSRPLAELVLIQCRREPAWVQQALKLLREISPVTFAMLQLTLISAIIWVADTHKKTRPEFSGRA